jgi:hypothetical protein
MRQGLANRATQYAERRNGAAAAEV